MRKRNTIRLNESQLHNMISESVKQVLKEAKMVPGTNYLGRPYGPKSFGQPHRVVDHNEKYFNKKLRDEWGPAPKINEIPEFAQTYANRLERFLNKGFVDKKDTYKVIGFVDEAPSYSERIHIFGGESGTLLYVYLCIYPGRVSKPNQESPDYLIRAFSSTELKRITRLANALFGSPWIDKVELFEPNTLWMGSTYTIRLTIPKKVFSGDREYIKPWITKNPRTINTDKDEHDMNLE